MRHTPVPVLWLESPEVSRRRPGRPASAGSTKAAAAPWAGWAGAQWRGLPTGRAGPWAS